MQNYHDRNRCSCVSHTSECTAPRLRPRRNATYCRDEIYWWSSWSKGMSINVKNIDLTNKGCVITFRLCWTHWLLRHVDCTTSSPQGRFNPFSRSVSAHGLVVSASASVLVASYQDHLTWYCSLLTRRTVRGWAAGNTRWTHTKNEIVQTQSWRYKTIVVIKHQQKPPYQKTATKAAKTFFTNKSHGVMQA